MKTTVNPRMNITEFIRTVLRMDAAPAPSDGAPGSLSAAAAPVPEIKEMYPGTSGSTHGDRNEIRPAANAAIGKGKLDITYVLAMIVPARQRNAGLLI